MHCGIRPPVWSQFARSPHSPQERRARAQSSPGARACVSLPPGPAPCPPPPPLTHSKMAEAGEEAPAPPVIPEPPASSKAGACPDFAVLCSFLERYGAALDLPELTFPELEEALEHPGPVAKALVELHLKLMRKIGKSVTIERWEKYLIRICQDYNSTWAWEMEKKGYQEMGVECKVGLLKHLCECQFDDNLKFKNSINDEDSDAMRVQPIGRDKDGLMYWYQLDQDHNVRMYIEEQDDQDGSSWKCIVRTRNDLAETLELLKAQIDPALLKKPEETSSRESPNPEDEEMKKENGEANEEDRKLEIKEEKFDPVDAPSTCQTEKDCKPGDKGTLKTVGEIKTDPSGVKDTKPSAKEESDSFKENVKPVKSEIKNEKADSKDLKEAPHEPERSEISVIVKRTNDDHAEKPAEDTEKIKNDLQAKIPLKKRELKLTEDFDGSVKASLCKSKTPTKELLQNEEEKVDEDATKTSASSIEVNEGKQLVNGEINSEKPQKAKLDHAENRNAAPRESVIKEENGMPEKRTSSVIKSLHELKEKSKPQIPDDSEDSPLDLSKDAQSSPKTSVKEPEASTTNLDCRGEEEKGKMPSQKKKDLQKDITKVDKESLSKSSDKDSSSKEEQEKARSKEETVPKTVGGKTKTPSRKASITEKQCIEKESIEAKEKAEKAQEQADEKDKGQGEIDEKAGKEDVAEEKEGNVDKKADKSQVKAKRKAEKSTVEVDGKEDEAQAEADKKADESKVKADEKTDKALKASKTTDKVQSKADKKADDADKKTDEAQCEEAEKLDEAHSKTSEEADKASKKADKANKKADKEQEEANKKDVANEKASKAKAEAKNKAEDTEKQDDEATLTEKKTFSLRSKRSRSAAVAKESNTTATEPKVSEEKNDSKTAKTPQKPSLPSRSRRLQPVPEEENSGSESREMTSERQSEGIKLTIRISSKRKRPELPVETMPVEEEEEADIADSIGSRLRRSPRIARPSVRVTEVKETKPEKKPSHEEEKRAPPKPEREEKKAEKETIQRVQKKPKQKRRACWTKSRSRRKRKTSSEEESEESDSEEDSEEGSENEKEAVKPEDEEPCKKCGLPNHPELILLCDSCDSGYHTACLRPPLMVIPDGEWFCPPCQHKLLCEKLEEQLTNLDVVLKKKERAERRRERLVFVGISIENIIPTQEAEEVPEVQQKEEKKKKKSKPLERRSTRARKFISYRFDEFDEAIEEAIEEDIRESEGGGGGGGHGKDMSNITGHRGKDISTILEAEKAREEEGGEGKVEGKRPQRAVTRRKKRRRLNDLDSDSNGDEEESEDEFQISEGSQDEFVVSDENAEESDEDQQSNDSDFGARRPRRHYQRPMRKSTRLRKRVRRYSDDDDDDDDESEDERQESETERSSDYSDDYLETGRRRSRRNQKRQVNYKEDESDSEKSQKGGARHGRGKEMRRVLKRRFSSSESDGAESAHPSLMKTSQAADKTKLSNDTAETASDFLGNSEDEKPKNRRRNLLRKRIRSSDDDSSSEDEEPEEKPVRKRPNRIETDEDEEEEKVEAKPAEPEKPPAEEKPSLPSAVPESARKPSYRLESDEDDDFETVTKDGSPLDYSLVELPSANGQSPGKTIDNLIGKPSDTSQTKDATADASLAPNGTGSGPEAAGPEEDEDELLRVTDLVDYVCNSEQL